MSVIVAYYIRKNEKTGRRDGKCSLCTFTIETNTVIEGMDQLDGHYKTDHKGVKN